MKTSYSKTALVALTALFTSSKAVELDVSSEDSIRSAAVSAAHGLMSYYKNNQSSTAAADVGTFPQPIYWWEAGAVWGGMVDYHAYTGDASYVQATSDALVAQIGPNADFLVPSHKGDEGNDDQAFWALSVMSAAENGFPQPSGKPLWAEIAANAFNNMVPRWNTDSCGGGFKWQIYSENSYGYNYRNSISNGGFFQLAARLARYTNNQTYVDWAEKVWDWTVNVGFISSDFQVFDGADDRQNCTKIDHNTWSYNNAIFLYGSAAMYAKTGDAKWKDRTNGLLKAAGSFFSAYQNSTDVMSEIVCEGLNKCNTDQASFKAYLGRWMAKTTVLAPFTKDTIQKYLQASAKAAAASCNGNTCGMKWFVGGFDGNTGVGQQLSAMEVIQSLLVSKAGTPGTAGNQGGSASSASSAAPSSTPAPSSSAAAPSSYAAASSSKVEAATTAPAPSSAQAPAASSSDVPGVFPEYPACSEAVETVTVTVPSAKPTPSAPSSSVCTLDIVTSTVTVTSSTPPGITPSSTSTKFTSLVVATGSPTVSSGFLTPSSTPTTSSPVPFTGAASPRQPQGVWQIVGAMVAAVGVVALV